MISIFSLCCWMTTFQIIVILYISKPNWSIRFQMEKNPHSNTKKVYKNVHKIFNYHKWWILSVFLWAAVKLDSQGITWISICVNRKVAKFTYQLWPVRCDWWISLPVSLRFLVVWSCFKIMPSLAWWILYSYCKEKININTARS